MEWILISEKMPELDEHGHSKRLIVSDGLNVTDDCRYIPSYGGFVVHVFGYDNDSYIVDDVTHWMELPNPPIRNGQSIPVPQK